MPTSLEVTIRRVRDEDAAELAEIYNSYVLGTCITFETEPVQPSEMAKRVAETAAYSLPWLVTEVAGRVIGYAHASRWKGRCAYRRSVESTIYLAQEFSGRGFGRQLYDALINTLRGSSVHTVIGGIALPNSSSIRLHERLGFKKVAHFEQVGYKQDRWVDVSYWQLILDR